jgi:hypothetical protein
MMITAARATSVRSFLYMTGTNRLVSRKAQELATQQPSPTYRVNGVGNTYAVVESRDMAEFERLYAAEIKAGGPGVSIDLSEVLPAGGARKFFLVLRYRSAADAATHALADLGSLRVFMDRWFPGEDAARRQNWLLALSGDKLRLVALIETDCSTGTTSAPHLAAQGETKGETKAPACVCVRVHWPELCLAQDDHHQLALSASNWLVAKRGDRARGLVDLEMFFAKAYLELPLLGSKTKLICGRCKGAATKVKMCSYCEGTGSVAGQSVFKLFTPLGKQPFCRNVVADASVSPRDLPVRKLDIPPGEERATTNVSAAGRRSVGAAASAPRRSKQDNARSPHRAQESLDRTEYAQLFRLLKEQLIGDWFPRWRLTDIREVRKSCDSKNLALTVELGGQCSCWCPCTQADHTDGAHVYFRVRESESKGTIALGCSKACFKYWKEGLKKEYSHSVPLAILQQLRALAKMPLKVTVTGADLAIPAVVLDSAALAPSPHDLEMKKLRQQIEASRPLPGSLCTSVSPTCLSPHFRS